MAFRAAWCDAAPRGPLSWLVAPSAGLGGVLPLPLRKLLAVELPGREDVLDGARRQGVDGVLGGPEASPPSTPGLATTSSSSCSGVCARVLQRSALNVLSASCCLFALPFKACSWRLSSPVCDHEQLHERELLQA